MLAKKVTKTDVALNRMIIDHPFFAAIILQHKLEPDPKIPTACVNARGDIRYNPDWFETLELDEIVFVLAHEVMHYLCMHCIRRGSRNPQLWNVAGDGHINPMLVASRVGKMPQDGIWHEGGADKATETIYSEMEDEYPDPPPPPPEEGDGPTEEGGSGGDNGSSDKDDDQSEGEDSPESGDNGSSDEGSSEGDEGSSGGDEGDSESQGNDPKGSWPPKGWGIGNDLDESEDISPAEAKNLEEQVRVEAVNAETCANQMGKMPAALVDFVGKIVHVKTPWYEKCKRFARATKTNDLTFDVIDRRFIESGLYLPFESGQGMSNMALIIDCSGSTCRYWDYFIGHFNKIRNEVKPDKVFVLYVTTTVDKVEEYTEDDPEVVLTIPTSGGTHMPAGVEYVEAYYPDVECMIVLTDGYTDFGKSSSIPVMWAITEARITSPHGETVHVDMED